MEQHQFPPTRRGLTRKFNCGLDVYLTVNLKHDGDPGEVFVKLGKQGSTVSGLMQAWAVTISVALQRGVPWSDLRAKFEDTCFEPMTWKINKSGDVVKEYSSLVDAVAQNVDDMIKQIREAAGQKTLDFDSEG